MADALLAMRARYVDMTDDDIPSLRRPENMPPIRTQADLWRHWRAMMGPLGFSERLLWVLFVDSDGRVTPMVEQFSDLPRLPDRPLVDSLMQICARVCADCGLDSVAMLLSRPGRAGITSAERTWAQRLTEAAAPAGVRMWPVHLANDHALVTVTPDDLASPRTAAG